MTLMPEVPRLRLHAYVRDLFYRIAAAALY